MIWNFSRTVFPRTMPHLTDRRIGRDPAAGAAAEAGRAKSAALAGAGGAAAGAARSLAGCMASGDPALGEADVSVSDFGRTDVSVVTNCHYFEDRLRSFELIAEAFDLSKKWMSMSKTEE